MTYPIQMANKIDVDEARQKATEIMMDILSDALDDGDGGQQRISEWEASIAAKGILVACGFSHAKPVSRID